MSAAPILNLVHSPLVGPSTWHATAEQLRELGHDVVTPSLLEAVQQPPPFHPRLAETAARAATEVDPRRPVALVAHSGAGALLPAVAAATPAGAEAAVFVDALLPHPGQSWFDTAPASLRERLWDLAVDGVLPAWSDWFPAEALVELIPDAEARLQFTAQLPRLALSYFEEPAAEVPDWQPDTCVYIQLSAAYQEQADEARRLGWTVRRYAADHLAMLTRPEMVAELVAEAVAAD